ncbi:MAG TPA: hypothetical protein VNR51_12580 [Hyphomicrobium sp.]|nr:hypothetical protein [Hyphomicrobium sp.]
MTWTAVGAAFFIATLVFALVAAYLLLRPALGSLGAVAALAGACCLVGIAALYMPTLIEKAEERNRASGTPVANAVAAVDEEAHEAVDYFGALRMVSAAFLFGLGAGRRLRR